MKVLMWVMWVVYSTVYTVGYAGVLLGLLLIAELRGPGAWDKWLADHPASAMLPR